MKFSKEIMEYVYTLRELYDHGNTQNDYIEAFYPIIEIKKIFKNHELFVRLIYDSKANTFEIQAPTYQYCSKISHYDYHKPENRWTRDKYFLFMLIRNLKKCGLWNIISNKDFLVVNSFNENITAKDVKELWKTLREIEK